MALKLLAEHIVKRYGGVVAVRDGSIEITSGNVVTLVGANGSGKSTLSYSSTASRSTSQIHKQPRNTASRRSIRN